MKRWLFLILFLCGASAPASAWQIHKSGLSMNFLFMTSSDITAIISGFMSNGQSAAEALVQIPSPVAGTATKIFASASAAYTGTITFRINGVAATDSGCTMSGTTTCNSTITAGGNVNVGDLIVTNAAGSGTARGLRVGVLITGAGSMGMTFSSRVGVNAGGATSFIGAGVLTVLGDERTTVPYTGTLGPFKWVTPGGVHTGIDYAITIVQNGSTSGTPTCTITSGTQSCTMSSMAVTAGDVIDIQVVGTGSGTSTAISGSAQGLATVGTNNKPIIEVIQDGTGASVFGYWRGSATESTVGGVPVPVACTAQNLYFGSRQNPTSATYTLINNTGATALTQTGGQTGSDTVHTVPLAAGDQIDIKQTSTGTGPLQWGASLQCQ